MALPILSGIFFVLWGLAALKKPDLVWKMEFCKIDEPSESYLPPCRSSSFAKAASQISNLALRSRVCGSGTNSQLKNQHISVIFQPYLHSEALCGICSVCSSYRSVMVQCLYLIQNLLKAFTIHLNDHICSIFVMLIPLLHQNPYLLLWVAAL